MVNMRIAMIIRRALITVQIYFDQRGNFMATNRSIANATITLRRRRISKDFYSYKKKQIFTMNSSNKERIEYNSKFYMRNQYDE